MNRKFNPIGKQSINQYISIIYSQTKYVHSSSKHFPIISCVASLQNSPLVGRNESGIIPD